MRCAARQGTEKRFLGLAGNLLTGGTPLSLSSGGCFEEITLQTPTTVCIPGTAATTGGTGGSWQNATCSPCQAGTFAASSGAVACGQCSPFTVAPQPGAVACDACPANSADAVGNTACVCLAGYYDAALGASATAPQCMPSPDGGDCTSGALLAQEGWWRETPTDDVFLKCREGYCLAEAPPAAPARRRLAQAGAGHCLEGHSGVLCAVCQDGFTLQGGFCKPCRQEDAWRSWSRASRGVTIALFVPAGLLLLTLLLLLPLLPAWENAMWRCTAALARAAEAVADAAGALHRRCCAAEAAPRRSSARLTVEGRSSTARWSSAPHADAPPADGDATGDAVSAEPGGSTPGVSSVDDLIEAATELFVALLRPGKILIKYVVRHSACCCVVR